MTLPELILYIVAAGLILVVSHSLIKNKNQAKIIGMKIIKHPLIKYPLILLGIIVTTSILFVLSQFIKDTFFLGPEPDLAGKSILFEAEGEGVQLFWRHYTEENKYTEEYLFDEPIEGDLSDVLLRDDGLWFVVDKKINEGSSDIYKVFESNLEKVTVYKKRGGKYILRLNNGGEEMELIERDYEKDNRFNILTMIFEQNYTSAPDYNKLSVDTGLTSCAQGFWGFGFTCLTGYIGTDKLIKNSDDTVVFKVRELATPMEVVILGKRFTSGVVIRNKFMLSKDEQFAFLFTHNANKWGYRHTYLTHIDSGQVMKISKGDVPVLMP